MPLVALRQFTLVSSCTSAECSFACLPGGRVCTRAVGTATKSRNQGGSSARRESQSHWGLFLEKEGIEGQGIK